jgi:hypothetical protein
MEELNKEQIKKDDKGYWIAFKEYHKHDVWGRFLKWLNKINKRHKKFIKEAGR